MEARSGTAQGELCAGQADNLIIVAGRAWLAGHAATEEAWRLELSANEADVAWRRGGGFSTVMSAAGFIAAAAALSLVL